MLFYENLLLYRVEEHSILNTSASLLMVLIPYTAVIESWSFPCMASLVNTEVIASVDEILVITPGMHIRVSIYQISSETTLVLCRTRKGPILLPQAPFIR